MIPSKHNSPKRIRWRRQRGASAIGWRETEARLKARQPRGLFLRPTSGFGKSGRGIQRGGTTKHKATVTLPDLKFLKD